ncbi:high affinity immunoglobulin epsilon receptor subunit beta [Cynocephalus volans]|uniref:high affinity immunoglobulin epsilon receptor subunit beta n=1 Tax=Cynocephalus volans TaxID=110931 RepID=UPI002FCB7234
MDMENKSRTDLALPNPQGPSRVPEFELSEISVHDNTPLKKSASSLPQHTWLTFLKKEVIFLGVTQILIGLICLCFGTIVCSAFNFSDFEEDFFLSFKAGYPFWGAIFFDISGLLSIILEKKNTTYLARGRLGANTVSSIAGGIGIIILIIDLRKSSTFIGDCQEAVEVDFCFGVSFSTEIVVMMLFLTILGFCSAVSLTVYGVGEELKGNKVPVDCLYEELNIYSPIYSELETRQETSPPMDS